MHLSAWPSFCQQFSQYMEIWQSSDKNNFAQFFWDTVYNSCNYQNRVLQTLTKSIRDTWTQLAGRWRCGGNVWRARYQLRRAVFRVFRQESAKCQRLVGGVIGRSATAIRQIPVLIDYGYNHKDGRLEREQSREEQLDATATKHLAALHRSFV